MKLTPYDIYPISRGRSRVSNSRSDGESFSELFLYFQRS